MRRDFIRRFADPVIKGKLLADFFAVAAQTQHDIRRFFHQKRSGNRRVVRFFNGLYLFRFGREQAHLPI